jgi:hypothetical protein
MNKKNKGPWERQEAQRDNNVSILGVMESVSERYPDILKIAEGFVKDVIKIR